MTKFLALEIALIAILFGGTGYVALAVILLASTL